MWKIMDVLCYNKSLALYSVGKLVLSNEVLTTVQKSEWDHTVILVAVLGGLEVCWRQD